METGVISVRRALRLGLLHRAVSTTSPRGTSASLMLGLTTVLWPHVGRYCLGTGPSWTFKAGHRADLHLLVYCLGVALGFSLILIIVLACIMYKMNQRKCLQCRGSVSLTTCPAVSSTDAGAQDADNLHYVALNLSNKKNRSRRQRGNMEEETLYAGIRQ
uniref:Uncharacterized protein n=1 Tax=Hucho hucho TaxID=62062 RepID=A0A4W5RTH6_9TELE